MRSRKSGSAMHRPEPSFDRPKFCAECLVGLLLGTAAGALESAASPSADAELSRVAADVELEEIVVTGTRIMRPTALEGTIPVTSIDAAPLVQKGDVNLGEALNDLPSLRSTLGQSNSTAGWGVAGLNILDLRGLGPERTLVLVNGHRHVTTWSGRYFVDVNTIPAELVERVDVVTGGNSAIYGSDAIAGVVNFVTRREFDGLVIRAQGGTSDRGDRDNFFASLTAGTNFNEGRGNVAVALEYSDSDSLYYRQRDDLTGAYSGRSQFNATEITAGEPGGSNGVPDNRFFSGGIFNANIADGGLIAVNASGNPASAVYCGRLPEPARSQRCLPNDQPRIFTFDRGGNLVETIPAEDFRPFGSGNVRLTSEPRNPGDLSSLRNTGQLNPGLEKAAINLLARYRINEAFEPFLEAKFVEIDVIQETQPSFWQNSIVGMFGGGSELRCNNPFLSAQALGVLQSVGRCANPATGTFPSSRFNVDFGGRGELFDRNTLRLVTGIEGRFNDDWHYEVSLNYGRLDNHMRELNDLVLFDIDGNPDGFLLAIDAVRDASGQIVCRVNADANAANDRQDCVPINVFGVGAPSRAALDFVNRTSHMDEEAREYVALAFVAGDLSGWLDLPGGSPAFAAGVEHRRETAFMAFDELAASGGTFFSQIAPFTPPDFRVSEVFAELRIPIVAGLPLARELAAEAAYRYSNYNTSTDRASAYNLGLVYEPIEDARVRGSYSRSVRAPPQQDLYFSASQGFTALRDPCDVMYVNQNPNRAANCAAAGVPDGFVNDPARLYQQQVEYSGNPTLVEEQSSSLTAGIVLMPRALPGFAFAVDYYDIEVDRLIADLEPQVILDECYGSPSGIRNNYCVRVYRNADSTFAVPAVAAGPINFARQETEGLDFDASFQRTLGNGHRLSIRGIATYVLQLDNYLFPSEPKRPNRRLSELGDPESAFNVYANYGIGSLELDYSYRYIGKMTLGTYEAQHAFDGRPAQNRDQYPRKWYPAIAYHDLRGEFRLSDSLSIFGGVDNLTDEAPPFNQLATQSSAPYDNIGRFYYAGVRIEL